jgi:hypothetical protein
MGRAQARFAAFRGLGSVLALTTLLVAFLVATVPSAGAAKSGPDPSLTGLWSVSCSGTPCATVTISIGGAEQEKIDPDCHPNVYCVTTPNGGSYGGYFYGRGVSLTPNGAGSWFWTCTGCIAPSGERISVHFKGSTSFEGTAQIIGTDGSVTGTVPETGTNSTPAKGSVSVAVSLGKNKAVVGGKVAATVTVSAGGEDLTGVSLGSGLVSSSGSATVWRQPSGLSGFSLPAGGSRRFAFTLKGVKPGKVTLSASAHATASAGSVAGSGKASLEVVGPGISGTVYGQRCGEGCTLTGLRGVKVLVIGRASDGSEVTKTDTTGEDGSWSVDVPAGKYTAGPTFDGSSFVDTSSGFEPPTKDNLSGTESDVNFRVCAHDTTTDSTRSLSSASVLAGAPAAGTVSTCESVYTFTLGGELPTGGHLFHRDPTNAPELSTWMVDPSEHARYEAVSGEYRDTPPLSVSSVTGVTNIGPYLEHTWPLSLLSEEEYPGCFTSEDIEREKRNNASVEWYSYLSGGSLPTYKVQLVWNKSLQTLTPLGGPTMSESWMEKIWVWKDSNGLKGYCYLKEPVITLEYTFLNENTFTMVTSTGFPFDARGVKEEETASHLANALKGILSLLPDDVAREVKYTWNSSPEGVRQAMEGALIIALTKGAGSVAKLTPAVSEAATGSQFTSEQLQALAKFGGPWEAFEADHSGSTIASYYNEFFGEYPLMNSVIRGSFSTVDGKIASQGDRKIVVSGSTLLAVSAKTTAFPTFTLKVTRTALGAGTQALPWAESGLGTNEAPATANSFSSNPPYVVNAASGRTREYQIGRVAVSNVEDDTSQLSAVNDSAHGGSLDQGYAAEREQGIAPTCSGAENDGVLKTGSEKTICWRIKDGNP